MNSINDRYRRALLLEDETPATSRRNAESLIKMLGPPSNLDLIFNEDQTPEIIVGWFWPGRDPFVFTFKGFDWQVHGPKKVALDAFLFLIGADGKQIMDRIITHRPSTKETLSIIRTGKSWFTAKAPAVVYERPPEV